LTLFFLSLSSFLFPFFLAVEQRRDGGHSGAAAAAHRRGSPPTVTTHGGIPVHGFLSLSLFFSFPLLLPRSGAEARRRWDGGGGASPERVEYSTVKP
jgi:hypothetical protein